jgi:deazaflavin-dependent oxidoreductase (nitroreductase family)
MGDPQRAVGAGVSTFLDFNRGVIEDLRANRGKATTGPFAGRELAILTTVGARTGKQSENPLAFTEDGDHLVVVASMGGAPVSPAWYHNLLTHPEVGVEVRGDSFRARASALTEGDEYERLYKNHADRFPSFWEYRQRTSRRIPVVVLERIDGTG